MKELQNFLYKHMDALKHHKRYVAMLTALSLLVSFMVPLILIEPADSMTKQKLMLLADEANSWDVPNVYGDEANNGYSPATLTEAELLIGRYNPESGYDNRIEWASGLNTAKDVIEAAKREYFLGIASDFCVFLEGDFNPSGADCEGRVAVGGNIVFDKNDDDSITNDYNYQLGSGDYTSMTALINTDNYLGVTDFAHAIVGGYIQSINTLSAVGKDESKWYERPDSSSLKKDGNGSTIFFPENEDLYKRFVVGTSKDITSCKHMTWPPPTWDATLATYSESCDHDPFTGVNEIASFYQRDMIDFGEVFDWIGTQSEKLAKKTAVAGIVSGTTVTFDGSSYPSDTMTYYFSLPAWDNSIRTVKFINVNENANLVVSCGGGGENDSVKPKFLDNDKKFSTYIGETCISKFNENGSENGDVGNNNKFSEQILYNFYEATDIEISAHLNGTVLAPNADVTSDKTISAHLSGSLIAQTFTGALEFGYRPYRGRTDILGSTAGYVVPFDKFVDDLNGIDDDNPKLAGATFEIKDEHENIVDTWTSTEETSYITFPTELDFAGGKNYTEDNKTVTHTYTISEKSAPEGYITTDKKYKIVITETVDLDYLLLVDNGTIPTRVTVNLELYEIDDSTETDKGTRTLKIRDGYDENQHVQRIIEVQNGENKDYFILTIENGNITKIEKVDNNSAFEELLSPDDEVNVSFNAVTYSGADIQADEAITVDRYPYAYTPENLLTDYNLFAFNELEQGTHVVGAMAAKTLVVGSSYGDAAKAHSYFSNLNGNPTYSVNAYFGSGEYAGDKANYYIYYNNPEAYDPSSNDSYYQRINNNYIDFDSENSSAKTSITSWSNNKATQQDAWVITDNDLTTLDNKGTDDTSDDTTILEIVVSDSTNKNIIIPEAISQQIQRIVFVGENNSNVDLENLADMDFVITLLGTKPGNSTVCGIRDGVPIINFNSYLKYRKDNNDVQIEQAFKNLNGNSNSQQVGLYGLKLIWNLPEVEECFVTSYSGHIVAPKATIELSGGEGSVIANNIKVSQEIHYYPYLANTLSSSAPVEERGDGYNGGSVSGSTSGGTGNESGGTTGGGTNDDETIVPQFPPITDYSATTITLTDNSKAQKLSDDYYYDPTSLMIMPLPDGTPSFTNEYALVFKKQSDESTALAGATIELQSGTISNDGKFNLSTTHGADSTPPWEWGNETNTYSIPLKKIQVKDLDTNVVYRFFEQTPPKGYEIAKPIYFVKKDNTTIRYTDDETQLSDINSWTPIEFSESNKSSNIITMTDYKIYGPEIKLSKVQIGSSNPLQGAEFVLYAVDGDTLVYPLNDRTKLTSDSNGEIDFTKVFKANPDNCNSEYIKNGYLVPSEYYLKETKAPDKYEVPTDNMYFIVEENNGNYVIRADKSVEPDYAEFTFDTAHAKEVKAYGTAEAVTSMEIYVTGASTIELCDGPFAYGTDYGGITANVIDGVATFTNVPPTITNFKIQNKDNYDSGLTVTAVKVYSTPIPPTEYTLNSEPQLSAGNAYEVGFNTEDNISGISTQSGNKTKTISVGSANANKTIEKIEFVISYVSGAGVQIKPNGNYDDQLVFSPDSADTSNPYEYVPPKTIKLDSNGNIVITCWNIVIDEIRFYIEGMESTGTCDLTVSNVKAYYIDGTSETATSINALPKKDNIIGLEVTLGGSGSGNIQVNDAWKATGVTAGETVTFGETNYTPPAAETGNSTLISVKDNTTDTLLVGNNQKGEKTNIKVVKVWSDSENLYNTRPNEIKVKLRRDGVDFNIPNTDSPILTLTAEKNWQAELKNLPSLKSGNVDDETAEYYQYSFVELDSNNNEIVPNGTLNCYTVSYGNPVQSGEFTITNTLKTTNIPVEKKWVDSTGKPISEPPNSVTVKLQKHNGSGYSDFLDKNGNAVTLVLSSNNNWAGEFTDIPEGQYQVVESVVPSGWTETRVTENGKTIITNTQKSGTLKLIKIWQNDTAAQRPENITIKIYRTTTPPAGTTMVPSATKSENVTEDYARLLQYSLYFYDAQMCGDKVGENSVIDWRNDCAVNYSTSAIQGGFHDAGDHLMFGLPQGFTASSLGWSYYENKNTFDSLGLTNHYKVIMKEFCDFFVGSTVITNGEVTNFLYQKGSYDEHSTWGPPENGSYHTNQERWTSTTASDISANYAAALAQYVINFGDPGNYLDVAKALYSFSTKNNAMAQDTWQGNNKGYQPSGYVDEQAWAAAWLYLATKDTKYANDCDNKLNNLKNQERDKRGYFWDREELAASIVYNAYIANEVNDTADWDMVRNYLTSKIDTNSNTYVQLDGWAPARHNTLLQMIAIAYDKHNGTNTYKTWAKNQMTYILGGGTNPFNTCFVVGFADNSSKNPHHRAASNMLDDYDWSNGNSWADYNSWSGLYSDVSGSHTLFGALVGGTHGSSYVDKCNQVEGNECALDYNAGLVGAAAALYSVYGTGHTVNADVMKADGLEIKDGKTIYEEQPQAASINIEDIMNTSAMSFKRNAVSVLGDIHTVTYSVNKTLNTTGNDNNGKCHEFNLSALNLPSDAVIKSVTVNLNSNNSAIQIGDDCGVFGFSMNNYNGSYWHEVKYTGTYSHPVSLTCNTSSFGEYIKNDGNFKFAIWWSSPNLVTIENYVFEYETQSNTPTVSITNPTTDSQTLVVGDTLQLTATSSDNSTITWNSSNTGAVQVDSSSDQLTAVGTGDATITATSSSGATDTVNIHVDALQISVNNKTDSATFAKDDTPTFTVNGQTEGHSFKWTSSNPEVLKINENTGQAEALKAGENITITVVKDGNESYKDTITVNVTSNFGIEVSPTVIRPGKSAQLSAINADGDVTYTEESDYLTIEEIDGVKYAKASDSVSTETQITITGNDGYSNSTCQLTINPIGNPSISAPDSKNRIGIGETLQLTASNILGTASWRLEDEDTSILTVDENGLVTGVSTGTTTIIVEDTDGTIGTYEITVAELAADPGLPDETILYTTVTLTSADNWEKIVNLPIEDENGKKYYYYIEEVTVNDVVNGNGGKYMPIKYEGQGVTLNEVGSETPEISVTNRLTQTIQGQLPSTGGSGVKTYYYLGGAIMLLGIAGFTGLKRRERKRREE